MKLSKIILPASLSLALLLTGTTYSAASFTNNEVSPVKSTIAAVKRFKDVSEKSSHSIAIHAMRDMGIIHGYADNTFKPNEPINRQNGTALLTRYTPMKYTGNAKFPQLTDVSKNNGNYTVLIEFQKLGIFDVKKDGKIYPTKAMTRAEIAKGIAIAFKLPIEPTKKSTFKDVKASDPYSPYIEAMYKAGLTNGYGDGKFQPNTHLSRAHFSSFMYRAINKYGKPTEEVKPTTPPVVEEKPVTPPTTGNTGGGSVSVGDFTKPTEYQGDFKYTSDGKVKFEDKKLEDYPLYAYPDYKNDTMYLNGATTKDYNAMQDKILVDRKGEIKVTGNKAVSIYYTNGKLNSSSEQSLFYSLKPYGFNEAESYRLITYLYYTGNVYKGEKLTAYVEYPQYQGQFPRLIISLGGV